MRKLIFAFGMALMLSAVPAIAQDKEAEAKSPKTQEEKQEKKQTEQAKMLAEALEKQAELETKLQQKFEELQDNADLSRAQLAEEMEAFQESLSMETDAIAETIKQVAKQAEADAESSLAAIDWLMKSGSAENLESVRGLIEAHHLNNPKLPDVVSTPSMPTQTSMDIYELIIEKSESKEIRGKVAFAQIAFLEQVVQFAPIFAGNESARERFPEVAEFLASEKAASINEDMLLERMKSMVEKYGDVKIDDDTLEDKVASRIKAIEIRRSVAVGKVAPEIEGPDIDGENFKLSDYRGKVVMLDFWGDW